MSLVDALIRAAVPLQKTQRLYDVRGLYLEVSPSGGKWWRLKYRHMKREKRLSLGTYPKVSLKEARGLAEEQRTLLRQGIDPGVKRKAEKLAGAKIEANSFEAVTREWFAMKSPGWATSHSKRVLRLMERDAFPSVGNRQIDALTAAEILPVLQVIQKRNALETAHRALRIFAQVFRYAGATGRVKSDPCSLLKGALPSVTEGHFPAVIDPVRLGQVLRMLDYFKGTRVVGSALRLAPLVFVRPGELRNAKWEDIDFEKGEWRFTASKGGQLHIVPLSTQAISILRNLHPFTGGGRLVFPSARGGGRPMSDNALLVALRTLQLLKEEITIHGWRATARTMLDEQLHFRPDFIEHQLAHAVRDPNGRSYNRTTFLPERRVMMQKWADYLDELKGAED